MGKRDQADQTPVLALRTEYSTPYSAILRDDVVMGVPRYFLERWVPVLGASSAALVNTLRQLDYRCQGDSIVISGEALAHESGMSRRHLYKCLETPWINAFIRQESGEKLRAEDGTITQQSNRYRVRMDDPLTPADADRLLDVLVNLGDDPMVAAQAALALEPREMWANDPKSEPIRFTEPRALTARDVLKRAFPTWQATEPEDEQTFSRLAEELHRHLVLTREDGRTSKIIVPQYFRRRWWSRLGHDLAWAYLWLRGTVYENESEGIRRDTCWVPALDAILGVIGRPREWWRRNVENAKDQDGWTLADFFTQIDSQKGRDPAHPQWVARQFRVALTIPIAPEDRAAYEQLLSHWPEHGVTPPAMSATNEHTGTEKVRHNQTHRIEEGLPQSDTPVKQESATNEHTGIEGVRHIYAQMSATSVHSKTESENPAPRKTKSVPSKQQQTAILPSSAESAAGAENETGFRPASILAGETENLIDCFAAMLSAAPDTPLYRCAAPETWLTQVWPEPVQPHTPAWDRVDSGALALQDLVALMLSVWVDSNIKHPPRYLSWLVQRWDAQPDSPPVLQWETWRKLAALPVGEWMGEGRRLWGEVAPVERRTLPFGLDILDAERSAPVTSPVKPVDPLPTPDPEPAASADSLASDGLDERPNGGTLTIRDIWQATLGQLSLQLHTATFANWVDGTRPVSYADGILTVEARHRTASEWLANRLNHTIERTTSTLAGTPITVRYHPPSKATRR